MTTTPQHDITARIEKLLTELVACFHVLPAAEADALEDLLLRRVQAARMDRKRQ